MAAFEEEFAAYVGARHACAVSSGTAALHLALLAAGVRPGDEVITTSHSFVATANGIRYCAAMPVFVDIQRDTFNINPTRVEEAITPRTRAILAVDQLGMPCDMTAISEIARRHSLVVIADSACAVGSEIRWNSVWDKVGKPHADIACFSFHPRKVITTGEGGMITTSHSEWDRQCRMWRQQGADLPDTKHHHTTEVASESYPVVGYNYRMTDLQAAVGREQLRRLPGIIVRRRALASRYGELLTGVPEISVPAEPSWARSNWQGYCVRLPTSVSQGEVRAFMADCGVASRPGVMCVHREQAYADVPLPWSLPEAEDAQDHGLILPLYPEMSDDDLQHVVQVLKEACRTP